MLLEINIANPIKGEHVNKIQSALLGKGYLASNDVTGVYDIDTAKAVKVFQKENNMVQDGKVNDITYSMFLDSKSKSKPGYTEEQDSKKESKNKDEALSDAIFHDKHDAFFSKDKTLRKDGVNIDIIIGDSIHKTLTDVHLRSVGITATPNGEALQENYEFTARDLKEYNI